MELHQWLMIVSRPQIAFTLCDRVRAVAFGIKNAAALKKRIRIAQRR